LFPILAEIPDVSPGVKISFTILVPAAVPSVLHRQVLCGGVGWPAKK